MQRCAFYEAQRMKGRIMKHDNIDDAIVNAVHVLTWGASAKSRSQPVSSNRRV